MHHKHTHCSCQSKFHGAAMTIQKFYQKWRRQHLIRHIRKEMLRLVCAEKSNVETVQRHHQEAMELLQADALKQRHQTNEAKEEYIRAMNEKNLEVQSLVSEAYHLLITITTPHTEYVLLLRLVNVLS